MMLRKTLLAICQDALDGVKDVATPTTIINNADPTAILLKSMATKVARELERGYNWQCLKREHTFTTENGTAAYDLPSDFRRFAPLTMWDRTSDKPVVGVSSVGWQGLKSGIIVSGTFYYFSVFGNQFNITPTPTSAIPMVFDYYTFQFAEVSTEDDTGIDDWTADDNICRLDGDLMTLGVTYRYLLRQGAPCLEEKADYMQAIKDLQNDDTPAPLIDTGSAPPTLPFGNIPDGSWDLST